MPRPRALPFKDVQFAKLGRPLARTCGMLNADADYARIVALLTKQQLAPYVSFAKTDDFNGIARNKTGRVVVRVSDGTIVSGDSSGIEAGDFHDRSNPVTHPTFEPDCYRAVGESDTTYDGGPAIKLDLVPTCKSKDPHDVDYPFTTLYANSQNLHPLDVSGTVPPTGDNKSVTVSLDQRYRDFDGRVLPTRLKVDVSGSGWMFWLQVHVTETYGDYRFLNSLELP